MMLIDPLYVLSGFFVGLLVGQTGVGGGSLMTPILVLLFGVHPATAVGTDLLYACATKSVGTAIHGLNHTVDWTITRRLALGSVPGTTLTLALAWYFDLNNATGGRPVTITLGVMLLLTALSLLFRTRFLTVLAPKLERIRPRQAARLTVIVGLFLGVVVTISSVGAGALGVTALLMLYPRHRMAMIVGSDIAHAVPLTLLAGIGHWWLGSVNWLLLISLLSGSIPGIVLGSYLSVRMPERILRVMLALVLVVVGGRLVF
jgi:uncharacterized membrane protein YfcA